MFRSLNLPRLVAGVLLSVLMLGVLFPKAIASSSPQAGFPTSRPAQASVSGKLIVAFPNKNAGEAEVAAVLARHGLALEQWLPELGLARARATAGVAAAAAEALTADPDIAYVTQERLSVEVADAPQDEFWGQQWGPQKVGLAAARDLAWGDPSVVIAVVDTGVSYWHWDLRSQIWINPGESEIDPATGQRTCDFGIATNGQDDDNNGYADDCRGYNFDTDNNNPIDVFGHGTAVAGIASAATNNAGHYTNGLREGVAGMSGGARIMALKAMNDSGVGSTFNIANAISYAADEGARVINLSLTLPVNYDPADAKILCSATDYALSKGVVVVGASGNHSSGGVQPVSYPAACAGVLAVGASTREDARASFSDAGSRLDLIAPGEGIFSTLKTTNTSYGTFGSTGSGTSFAAPHAAGAAALIRSLRPDLPAAAITDLLRSTADDVNQPGFDPATGWGRLNVAHATAKALDGLVLSAAAEPASVSANNPREIRIRVTGLGGVPAGVGARIRFVGTLGVISPTVATVDATGIARATFMAGPTPGTGKATATLGSLSTSLDIPIVSGLPASISLAFAPRPVPVDGHATITASVRDDGGNLVETPAGVTFAVTAGSISPGTTTTTGGFATAELSAPPKAGYVQIVATLGTVSSAPLTIWIGPSLFIPMAAR